MASIGVIFAMLSALTLLPAILFFGRTFWPKRIKYDPETVATEHGIPSQGIWPKIARMIQKRPRVIWSVTTLALLAGVAFIPQLKADGVAQSELVLGASEARDGQEALGEHFPGGSGSPIQVIANEEELDDVANVMLDQSAIEDVSISAKAKWPHVSGIRPSVHLEPAPNQLWLTARVTAAPCPSLDS